MSVALRPTVVSKTSIGRTTLLSNKVKLGKDFEKRQALGKLLLFPKGTEGGGAGHSQSWGE